MFNQEYKIIRLILVGNVKSEFYQIFNYAFYAMFTRLIRLSFNEKTII
jgi:hypothetical protein